MPLVRTVLVTLLALFIGIPSAIAHQNPQGMPIEVEGFPLSLSPDGASIAGPDATGERFCVWDLSTLESACDGDLTAPVEARSVTWAPDSSAEAFSLGASSRLVDSDIHVFEVTDGVLKNLTEDDPEGTGADDVSFLAPQDEPVAIDAFPAWSPDGSTLLFARTMWGDEAVPGVTLMTIPRDGGEPDMHAELENTAPLAVAGPMVWREDGRVVLTTRHPDPANALNAIQLLQTDGTMTTLVDGSADGPITDPVLASVAIDGMAVSAWSRLDFHENLWAEEIPIFFHVDVKNGMATPWSEYAGVDLPDGARLLAPPVFGPEDSVAFLWRVKGGDMGISVLDGRGTFRTVSTASYAPVTSSPRNLNGLNPTLQWAGDGTLLLTLVTGGTLVSIGQEGATPVATPAG